MTFDKKSPMQKIASAMEKNKKFIIVESSENKLVVKHADDAAGILFFVYTDDKGIFNVSAGNLILRFKTSDAVISYLKTALNARKI